MSEKENELDIVVQEFKAALAMNKAFYGSVSVREQIPESEYRRRWEWARTHLSNEKKRALYEYAQNKRK